jgi:hypothetical protein
LVRLENFQQLPKRAGASMKISNRKFAHIVGSEA